MKRKETEAILAEWADAWRRRDPAALTARFSEGAVYASMLAGTIHGHAAIESLYLGQSFLVPDSTIEDDASLTPCINRITQVISDQCAIGNFSISVSNINITGYKNINRP